MIARILSVYWVIGSQFWACKSRRQSSLDCWHPETYALSTPSMNHFCLWCSEVNCWQEEIHKFKTEYLLIWQKYLSTWTSIKYFGHQVPVSTKYFWISKGQVQVSTKYSIIRIKYQVPSTSTLLDPNPAEFVCITCIDTKRVFLMPTLSSLVIVFTILWPVKHAHVGPHTLPTQ